MTHEWLPEFGICWKCGALPSDAQAPECLAYEAGAEMERHFSSPDARVKFERWARAIVADAFNPPLSERGFGV